MSPYCTFKVLISKFFVLCLLASLSMFSVFATTSLPVSKAGTLWEPYIEWSFENPGFSGNAYDIIATVTFTHIASGETHKTEMFYHGNSTWKFRFTGTRTGEWTFSSLSTGQNGAPALDGQKGTFTIDQNPNPDSHGFMKPIGNKWGWQGTEETFIPQYVMGKEVHLLYNNSSQIDDDINEFMGEHGFNGFHIPMKVRWFDIDVTDWDLLGDNPNPDRKTFEAIEELITKTHKAGGAVHLWMWGKTQRNKTRSTIDKWGKMSSVDKRLLRYIAARLGPLPGWSMGYGFDVWAWANANELQEWHDYLKSHLGWDHMLGARAHKEFTQIDQYWTGGDYSGYETHRPAYDQYIISLANFASKPSLMEDRFRIRDNKPFGDKDYDFDSAHRGMTRKGLWHSSMAGGVANIWGNLLPDNSAITGSKPYDFEYQKWIRTYADFFRDRFLKDMTPANNLTDYRSGVTLLDGDLNVCLKKLNTHYLFYKENSASVRMDLSEMNKSYQAVAVDTKAEYAEINLGLLSPNTFTWNAPYTSDWAVAVGDFGSTIPSDNTLLIAVDDSATTSESASVTINVIANDTNVGARIDPATLAINSNPSNGSVVVNDDGTVTYIPDFGFIGTDTFTYTVQDDDGDTSNVATVTVTVTGVNDTFVYYSLEAESADNIASPMQVVNDAAASGGQCISVPNGLGNNMRGTGAEATYTVNITQAGEYTLWGRVRAPSSSDDSFFVKVGNSLNKAWSVQRGNSWLWDKVNIKGGLDPVTYKLTIGTHTIKIGQREDGTMLDKLLLTNDISFIPSDVGDNSPPTSNNTPPIAGDDSAAISENASVEINVIFNDTDSDGSISPGTVAIISNPNNGTVDLNGDGTIMYMPDLGFTGTDTFTYTVQDDNGGTSNVATVAVTVTGINDTFDYFSLEAEHADNITSPMQVASDGAASGGGYIWVPNGRGNNFNGTGAEATYTVNITKAGKYILWGRVIAPSSSDDSFFVKVGNSSNKPWSVQDGNSWIWDKVNIKGGVDPLKYNLTAGPYTIKIGQREDGTKLDKLLLTNDMNYIPDA